MEREAESENKERRVSRFGRECAEGDEPVEYKPIVRKGGRKKGQATGIVSRVPVKSSISRPADAVKPPKRTAAGAGSAVSQKKVPDKVPAAPYPEEKAEKPAQFDINGLMDMISSAADRDIQTEGQIAAKEEPEENWEMVMPDEYSDRGGPVADEDIAADLELPSDRAVIYGESKFREEDPDIPRTPFEKRKAALACGVPAKFFCAMNNAGYLEGKITKESASRSVRLFMTSRLVEKVNSGDVSSDEMDRVSDEIERLRRGMTAVISEKDIPHELTPEDIFRVILEKIRRTR